MVEQRNSNYNFFFISSTDARNGIIYCRKKKAIEKKSMTDEILEMMKRRQKTIPRHDTEKLETNSGKQKWNDSTKSAQK